MVKRILLLVSIMMPCGVVLGQSIEQGLTLEQALETAYAQSPALKAARYNSRAALFSKRAAFGLRLPQLSATAAYTYMSQDIGHFDLNDQKDQLIGLISGLPIPPQIIGALKGVDLSYTLQKRDFGLVGANLVVPIYTGGKINAANNAAKIRWEQSSTEMRQAENTIFTEVSERYWGLALARNIEAVQAQLVSAMEMHAQNAAHLEANGMIAKGERLFVEMSLSQARAALSTASGNTATINSALKGSLSDQLRLTVTDVQYTPLTAMFIATQIEPLSYFKQKVSENSLALEQMDQLKRLAKEAVRAERAGFVPQVAAMGGINIWDYNLTDQLPKWFVGAGVTLNIFDGLQREYRYSAARNQVRRMEQLQSKAQIDIQVLVEKLYGELISATAAVKASQATIEFATEYLRVKKDGFSQGMATATDVMDAELNLSKSRVERIAAAYRFDVALANLLTLSGEGDRFDSYLMATSTERIVIN